jgi:hypothetical protein
MLSFVRWRSAAVDGHERAVANDCSLARARRRGCHRREQAIALHLTQSPGEHLLADAFDQLAEPREAQFSLVRQHLEDRHRGGQAGNSAQTEQPVEGRSRTVDGTGFRSYVSIW